jgi:hypothetical protein
MRQLSDCHLEQFIEVYIGRLWISQERPSISTNKRTEGGPFPDRSWPSAIFLSSEIFGGRTRRCDLHSTEGSMRISGCQIHFKFYPKNVQSAR